MKRLKLLLLFIALVFAVKIGTAQKSNVNLKFENATNATEILKKYVTVLKNANVESVAGIVLKDTMDYGLSAGLDSLNNVPPKMFLNINPNQHTDSISNELHVPVKVIKKAND